MRAAPPGLKYIQYLCIYIVGEYFVKSKKDKSIWRYSCVMGVVNIKYEQMRGKRLLEIFKKWSQKPGNDINKSSCIGLAGNGVFCSNNLGMLLE